MWIAMMYLELFMLSDHSFTSTFKIFNLCCVLRILPIKHRFVIYLIMVTVMQIYLVTVPK